MSKDQSAAVNEKLRRAQPAEPPTVEAMRAGFATMMATMQVADGIRTSSTTLGERPALLVEPAEEATPR